MLRALPPGIEARVAKPEVEEVIVTLGAVSRRDDLHGQLTTRPFGAYSSRIISQYDTAPTASTNQMACIGAS